jgi:hypothetical protein
MPAAVRRSWYEANKPPLTKPTSQSQPKSTVAMNAETAAAWDAWARGHVANGTNMLAQVIGQEVGKIERRLAERITELENSLGQLRAQTEILRNVTTGAVVDLPSFLRRKENAA